MFHDQGSRDGCKHLVLFWCYQNYWHSWFKFVWPHFSKAAMNESCVWLLHKTTTRGIYIYIYREQEFNSILIAQGDKYWMFYTKSIQAANKSLSFCYTEVVIINLSELQCHMSDITLKITTFIQNVER